MNEPIGMAGPLAVRGADNRVACAFVGLLFFCVFPGLLQCAEELKSAAVSRAIRTNLLVVQGRDGTSRPIATESAWENRKAEIRKAMETIMGPLPGPEKMCALDLRVIDEKDMGSFVRREVVYTSEPGGDVPAYLLIPKKVLNGGKARAVLALHQTRPEGQKVVVGLANSPNDEYGVDLANRGFVVLAPPYSQLANYWPDLKKLGYASGTMKSIWDNIRGLDLLASLPFVRTNGFGVIGHSLGGHNGVFTAAFDSRLIVVVSSCGLDSFVDYYDGDPKVWQPERGWCQTRYMPKLSAFAGRLQDLPFDFPEIIASIAPRACFLSAPIGDTNFRWRSVDAVVTAVRPVYQLFNQPTQLQVVHPEGGHGFSPEARAQAYQFIEDHLR